MGDITPQMVDAFYRTFIDAIAWPTTRGYPGWCWMIFEVGVVDTPEDNFGTPGLCTVILAKLHHPDGRRGFLFFPITDGADLAPRIELMLIDLASIWGATAEQVREYIATVFR